MSSAELSLLIGFVLLYGGGEALVRGAEALALRFGIKPLVVFKANRKKPMVMLDLDHFLELLE